MPAFPALPPVGRSYSFGRFPLTTQSGLGGNQIKFLHSQDKSGVAMTLTYENLTQVEMASIRDHYRGRQGTFLCFLLPDEIWAGHSSVSNIVPVGTTWKYVSPPEETQKTAGYVDVTVSLGTATLLPRFKSPLTVKASLATGAVTGAAVDPYWLNVSLLLPFNGTNGSTTFTDASSNAFVGSGNGNAQISTTDPKFGTGCLLLDGTGDFIDYAHNSAFSIDNVFTIEAWVRFSSFNAGDTDTILSKWANAGSLANDEFILYYSVNKLFFDFRDNNGSTYHSVSSSVVSLSTGIYYYFAVSRNGSSWTFNVNGTTSTATNSSAIRNTGGYAMMVGRIGGYTLYDLNGRIDELRLTKGVARDISSVPTAAFRTS